MTHDCNQNIESNMTPAHCSFCGKEIPRTLEEEREAIVEKLTMALTHSEQGEYAKNEKFVRDIILSHEAKVVEENKATEDTSDGYHTFKELYEFRLLYNAYLFNEWAKQGMYDVHKSQRHADGELCFGRNDYFIVVATLPTGQISNHYPMSDWDLFKCEVVEKAKEVWDGHTSQDVATRLRQALTLPITDENV